MREATLISTGDRPVLRFERFLPRPVEEVWHAVTDPVEMRAWFPTRIEIDRWEAGASLTHHFDGQPLGPLPGSVIECSEPHRPRPRRPALPTGCRRARRSALVRRAHGPGPSAPVCRAGASR